MFMDDIKNEYFYPMGGTSVVLEKDKSWTTSGKEGIAVVHPSMARFIDALRVKRPTWRFKSTEAVYYIEGQELRNFIVYDGNEQLGRVWTDRHWRTAEERYYYNNHRLEKSRQRNGGGFSTKVAVAVKKVLDQFSTKSLDELAEEAAAKVTNVTAAVFSTASYAYSSAKQKVTKALQTYIEANWETLKPYTTGCDDIDLRELRLHYDATDKAYQSRDRDGSATVFMHGDQMVMNRKGSEAKVVTLADLTDKQRAALGMLKLMEDKAFIPEVGVRVDRETFYLLD